MKNRERYQRTFSKLAASEKLVQEVLDMDQKKVTRMTRRGTGAAIAAALALGATGAAYAATDGGFAQLLSKITLYINGEEAALEDYAVRTDADGNSLFTVASPSGAGNDVTVTIKPEAAMDPDAQYSIDVDTRQAQAAAEDLPFALEAGNGRLYLVERDGTRLDITESAASEEGCRYSWTDADGNAQQAVILGTPEQHCVALRAGAAVVEVK